jgi:dTDP-4-amino-4,6-dideoxygalactose transaminase
MILMNDFKAEPEDLKLAELKAAERVIRSGWYILGNELKAFEKLWADRCGTSHCLGVGNGMDAIEIALRALRIGPGDEVITTPMTAFATVLAVIRTGATPVLADIDPETGLLDPQSVKRCLSKKTKAVLLVHLYGHIRGMDGWKALCKEAGVFLIEDCAQAHLAKWRGQAAGSHGEAGAYSFYPTKNLGTLGDGGALVTQRADVAEASSKLRNYGQDKRYYHSELGLNSRLDEIHAAILSARLEWLETFTKRRQAVGASYREGIRNPKVRLLAVPVEAENHVYHLFPILCDRRDELMAHLKSKGVESLIHYPVPVHQQQPCLQIARDPKGLPAAEKHAGVCVSIPCHPQISDTDVAAVIGAVNAF